MAQSKNMKEEVVLSDEQIKKLQNILNDDKTKSYSKTIIKSIGNFFYSLFSLKKSGKWISLITICFVLYTMLKFLTIQNFSIQAMELIAPYLAQIAITVFGIIGGVKGAEGIINKVRQSKDLVESVKDFVSTDEKK